MEIVGAVGQAWLCLLAPDPVASTLLGDATQSIRLDATMFRSLLTPLAARFQVPATSQEAVEQPIEQETPEELERDARVEEMRYALEDIKSIALDDLSRKVQVRRFC